VPLENRIKNMTMWENDLFSKQDYQGVCCVLNQEYVGVCHVFKTMLWGTVACFQFRTKGESFISKQHYQGVCHVFETEL
jgi:hypothetical protein